MCGRITLHHSPEEIAQRFAAQEILFQFPPRYNVAPMQPMAVITQNAFGDGRRLLEPMRWGLVPSWSKDDQMGAKLINARSETLAEKPSFRTALKRRRCLIPADGFYEWKGQGKAKQPHHIRFKDGRLFAFAGLFEEWQSPDGSPLRTCTIATGEPNSLLATLHHRMAVILEPEAEEQWIDPALTVPEALSLLKVFPPDELEAYPVDRRVGNVLVDDEYCIAMLQPLAEEVPQAQSQLSLME